MSGLTNEESVDYSTENDKKWCVYMHTNKINNKVYVGITSRKPQRRWGRNGSNYQKENQPAFVNAIQKYGWDSFEHIIFAENLTKNEAVSLERGLIALYKTNCNRYTNPSFGYNLTDGGEGTLGHHISDEGRASISEKAKERFKNPKNHPMYGKRHSESGKQKMSETRQNLASSRDNKYINSIRVNLCQYDKNGILLDEFIGVRAASEKTGISRSAIANCLAGLSCTSGGYIWKKKEDLLTEEDIRNANTRTKSVRQSKTNYKRERYDKWYNKKMGKWQARYLHNNNTKYLGSFLTEIEADNCIMTHKNNLDNNQGD